MLRAPRAPWVTYHNIIGQVPKRGLFSSNDPEGDGVVDVSSAHMDDVESEIMVSADHQNIHNTPRAILEVRRILIEHLEKLRNQSQVAERLDGRQPQRISNSESVTTPPIVQISTGNQRVQPPRPESPDSWWLPRWLGEGNNYSGQRPATSQQSMQELMQNGSQPAAPKPERSVPWLRPATLGSGSSRKM